MYLCLAIPANVVHKVQVPERYGYVEDRVGKDGASEQVHGPLV